MDYEGEFHAEQERLGSTECMVLHQKRSKSLILIKAVSGGTHTVGHTEKVYDSPRSRELAVLAGYLPCDGREFDQSIYPELARRLGKNKVPYYNAAS